MQQRSPSRINPHKKRDAGGTRHRLRSWAAKLPKIDLHRHLEGSLRLTTLIELAEAHDIALPTHDVAELRPYVQMAEELSDFTQFLEKFDVLRRFYISKTVIQRITREAIADAALDNIIYLELRFNPLALARVHNFTFEEVVSWVIEAAADAQAETGTRTCLILQIPRTESLEIAHEIVDLAIANSGPLVRGVDLAGDEVDGPPQRFAEPFGRAFEAGLHITVHAGEWVGPESVQAALEYLHPTRIGHGVRAIENSNVIKMLRRQQVALEVCPTSNLHTGVVRDLSKHPLVDLVNLGLRVTLNTDDPGISAITLSHEYVVAVEQIGMPRTWIYQALRHAVDAAFIPDEEREPLRAKLAAQLAPYPEAVATFEAAGL
ncbi:MAG: adenosine deaminase [Anaerolineae bacterium]|nr:adenosine deaminase [Anaerolineae bacterium]